MVAVGLDIFAENGMFGDWTGTSLQRLELVCVYGRKVVAKGLAIFAEIGTLGD